MTWRTVQLGNKLCDQDQIILNLFGDRPVRYIGNDNDFSNHLNVDYNSKSVIAIFNHPAWLSEFLIFVKKSIRDSKEFYLGINRYQLLGNDTTHQFPNGSGEQILLIVKDIALNMNFTILQSGTMDDDAGRYFNFVQPVTWIYGTNKNN